ncbi:hypothetical protein RBH29_11145 [Herbivorax sp. ANBcel31]|uniref:hypothetical protein n=1 Tax=Herbivorax sp. ANBcel31 TaxID=3069754 RepID=UPI0027B86F72|nr:hypothetical protein [Herbivorax sp. ANBcel31]MDQ2086983.1 hypothetical protein [Herbivorax sp. ANBcel31]
MTTGFSNVRSMEYLLIHELYKTFKDKFEFYYPFFFQRKRDDTLLSSLNYLSDIKLVALFARRPKTDSPNSNFIEVTFRQSLFEQAYELGKNNVSAICGSPLATRIKDIGFGAQIQWFIIKNNTHQTLVTYEFIDGEIETRTLVDEVQLIDDSHLLNILNKSPKLSWNKVLEKITKWNEDYIKFNLGNTYSRFFATFNNIQKPVFIAYRLKSG